MSKRELERVLRDLSNLVEEMRDDVRSRGRVDASRVVGYCDTDENCNGNWRPSKEKSACG